MTRPCRSIRLPEEGCCGFSASRFRLYRKVSQFFQLALGFAIRSALLGYQGGVAARGGASDSGDFNSRDCPFPLSVLYLFDFAKTLSETGIETAGLNCKSMQSRHLWQMPTSLFGPLFFGLSFVGNSLLP